MTARSPKAFYHTTSLRFISIIPGTSAACWSELSSHVGRQDIRTSCMSVKITCTHEPHVSAINKTNRIKLLSSYMFYKVFEAANRKSWRVDRFYSAYRSLPADHWRRLRLCWTVCQPVWRSRSRLVLGMYRFVLLYFLLCVCASFHRRVRVSLPWWGDCEGRRTSVKLMKWSEDAASCSKDNNTTLFIIKSI